MYAQVSCIAECFPTLLAAVRSLPSVCPQVDFELVVFVEALPTVRAGIRLFSSVDAFMYPELTGMGICFSADGAAIGSLSGVCTLVGFQEIRPTKAFTTIAAAVSLPTNVGFEVDVE